MNIEAHGRGKEVLMMEGQVVADGDQSVTTPDPEMTERDLNAQPDRPEAAVLDAKYSKRSKRRCRFF
eukprot:2803105-Amphidinium_carterae.2